jgi:hypothetical protein
MRDNEIHLGSFSELKLSDSKMDEVKAGRIFREKKIAELKNSDNAKVRAFIVQSFEPRFFYVCPSCKKKAVQEGDGFICAEHGKVPAEKRALINIILDDGTETIRTVAFQDNLAGLGLTDLENTEELIKQRESLLGKEMFFHGTVRNNKVFNTPEFIIDKVELVNPELLIAELELN